MNELQIRLMKFSVSVSNQTDGLYKKPQLESVIKILTTIARKTDPDESHS